MAADCFSAINRAVSVMNAPAMQRAAAGLAAMNILPDPSAYFLPDPIKYAGLRPTSIRPPNEVSILSFRSVVERFPETVIDEIGNDEDSIRQEDRVILSDLGIPFCSVQLQASYPDDSIDLMAKHVLTVIERFLRVFVTERLQSLYGPRWFELRVPNCLLKRWRSLEARGQRETGRRYPIIQYSSFMDLLEIITEPDNWKSVFQPTFREIEDIRVSFHRLLPIRNHIAHNRSLSQRDQITLVAEANRILGQLGHPIVT